MMRRFFLSLIMLWFVLPLMADENQKKPVGKISFYMGDIKVQGSGNTSWSNATFNTSVAQNDKVKTDKQSRCEVTFTSKKVMRVGEKSIVEITKDEAGAEEVSMKKGSAWLSMFLPKGKSSLKLKTPSSVCSIRGTVYRLDCDENQTTYRCYQGEIDVTPFEKDGQTLSQSTFSIGAGEELILVMDFEEYKKQQEKAIEENAKKQMEDFENWQRQQDKQFEDMLAKDEEDFKKVNDINYKKTTFNRDDDMQSDWVQWNIERDKLLQRQ